MGLAPFVSPVTTPMIRPFALVGNAAVMSGPSRSILMVAGRTKPGTVTSTSALPPLMRSARFDRVVIVVPLTGGAAGASLPPHPKSTNDERAAASAASGREYFKVVSGEHAGRCRQVVVVGSRPRKRGACPSLEGALQQTIRGTH